MKNFIKIILLSIIALCLIGCADSNNNNSNGDAGSVDTTELKMALYEKLLGTWEAKEGQSIDKDRDWEEYYSVIFASDSITFDGDVHSFSPSGETLLLEEEVPEEWRWKGETLYFYLNSKYYSVIIKDDNNITISYPFYSTVQQRNNAMSTNYVKKSNAGSGSTGTLNFSVVGDWGYKINGTTDSTLRIQDNGNFSFSTISGNHSGTYTIVGNKITFEFNQNASMNIKDTFTISGSEDEITLTLVESISTYNGNEQKSTTLSGMLNAFYGVITSTTITLSK